MSLVEAGRSYGVGRNFDALETIWLARPGAKKLCGCWRVRWKALNY